MNFFAKSFFSVTSLFFMMFVFVYSLQAQPADENIIRKISYQTVSNFIHNGEPGIAHLKMSANGAKIVGANYGTQVYTMNADGSNYTEVYNYRVNSYILPNISDDGSKIMWIGWNSGKFYVANSDGSGLDSIAPQLPMPGGGTTYATVQLRPHFSGSGQIYFINLSGGPEVAGVWRMNTSGGGLTQIFSWKQMAQDLFGNPNHAFNANVALAQDFVISDDGTKMVFGEFNFASPGDGYTIAYDQAGSQFHILLNYAPAGAHALAISGDGSTVVLSPWHHPAPVPLIAVSATGDSSVNIVENVGNAVMGGITPDGSKAMAFGDNIPISVINTDGSGRVEALNSPSLGIGGSPGIAFYGGLADRLSMTDDAQTFCFPTDQIFGFTFPFRIWVAKINPSSLGGCPVISNVRFSPDYVSVTGGASVFRAEVAPGSSPVQKVCYNTFKNGVRKAHLYDMLMFDNGTAGDSIAGDGIYTYNAVYSTIQNNPTPDQPYTIRISALGDNQISVMDVAPFYILNQVNIENQQEANAPSGYSLGQNYPNPFNPTTNIEFSIPKSEFVKLKVYNILGEEVATLVSEKLPAGKHKYTWDAAGFAGGVYLYRLQTGSGFTLSKKLLLIK